MVVIYEIINKFIKNIELSVLFQKYIIVVFGYIYWYQMYVFLDIMRTHKSFYIL